MEIRRLIYDRRTVITGVFLLFLALLILFFRPADDGTDMILSADGMEAGEKQVQDIIEESSRYDGISLFANTDSFAYKNVQKTKKDYMKILSVRTPDADTSFLDSMISCHAVNPILLVVGFLMALSYSDPVSAGLQGVAYAAEYGRGRRRARQICALMIWSGAAVVLLYGGALMIWLLRTGSEGVRILALPLQAMSIGRLLPFRITILAYLIWFLFFRWLVFLQFVLFIWTAFLVMNHLILSCGMLVCLFLAEYGIWQLIGTNSSWNLWKYCNLWYQLSSNEYLYTYYNVNAAGYPVDRYVVILIQILLCLLCLTATACLKGEYSRPGESAVRISFSLPLAGRLQEKMGLLTAELYKLLKIQKGIVLILLFTVFAAGQSDFVKVTNTGYQDLYYAFMEKYEGEPSEESEEYIRTLTEESERITEEYREAEELFAQGLIATDEYLRVVMKYDAYENERKFLEIITDQQEYLQMLQSQKGIRGWYVNHYCWQSVFPSVFSDEYGVLLIFTLLLSFASAKVEKDAGTSGVLSCTRLGRDCLLFKKAVSTALGTGMMFVILTGITIGSAACVYGISALDAPVQSLEKYCGLPFDISLLQWLILYHSLILSAFVLVSVIFTVFTRRILPNA